MPFWPWPSAGGSSGPAGVIPTPGQFLYACVDYDARVLPGDDLTGAFGIGATAAGAIAQAQTTPFKTLEQVGNVMPRIGNDAIMCILVKGRTGGATYLKKDAITAQDGTWRNTLASWRRWIVRPTGDFTDSTADRIQMGFVTAPGTNVAGYNPTAGATVNTIPCQNAGGGAATLPLEAAPSNISTINGLRIRFDANTTTAALRNVCTNVWTNSAGQIITGNNLVAVPALTDVFFVETTEYQVGSGTSNFGTNSQLAITGERWTAGTTFQAGYSTCILCACESTASTVNISRGVQVSFTGSSLNTDGTFSIAGTGGRYVGAGMSWSLVNSVSFQQGTVGGQLGASGCSVTVSNTLSLNQPGGGSVFAFGLNIANGAGAVNNFNSSGFATYSVGNLSSATLQRLLITGASTTAGLLLNASGVRIEGVDINNQTANCIIVGSAGVSPGFAQSYDNLVSSRGGNTGTILVTSNAQHATLEWARGVGGNTITTTGIEISLAVSNGLAANFAGLANTNYWDPQGNNVIGSAGVVMDKPGKLVSNGSGAAIAQGAVLRSTGLSNQVIQAQGDTAAHAAGIVGVAAHSVPGNGGNLLLVPIGATAAVLFDASLPVAGGIAYLSTSTAGDAQSGIPAAAATNQKNRLGIVRAVTGAFGHVALNPDNLATLADGAA